MDLDCVEMVKKLMAAAQQRAEESRRCLRDLVDRYRDHHDMAWWPQDPLREPVCSETLFFYRPGQLLVRASELTHVRCVLAGLGVTSCVPERSGDAPVARVLVATAQPAPLLVRRLRQLGLGPRTVTLNHVWWPSFDGLPWLSGGAGSAPRVATGDPAIFPNPRGSGVNVAVFDSALLTDWHVGHPWMSNVAPFQTPRDVDTPDGGPNADMLDIFDSHGVAVSGVVAARAPQASVYLRDVLNEPGHVDEACLFETIRQTLEASPGPIHIVNLSLGGTTMDNQPPLELASLLGRFRDVVFVAAAGNNGPGSASSVWPAASPGVIGVGALDTTGAAVIHAPFSNDYPSADVWAPGKDVLTAFGRGLLDYAGDPGIPFTGKALWSGTSFAAPYVTGLLCGFVESVSGSADSAPAPAVGTAAPSMTSRALRWLVENPGGGSDVIQISSEIQHLFG
jgi:hypothetical protein